MQLAARGCIRYGWVAVLLGMTGATVACSSNDSGENVAVAGRGEKLSFKEWKDRKRVPKLGPEVYAVGDQGVSPYGIVGEEAARRYYAKHYGEHSALTVDNGQTEPGVFPDPKIGSYPPGAVLKYCIDRAAMRAIAERFDLPGNPDNVYSLVDIAFGSAAAAWNTVAGEYSSSSGLSIQHAFGRDDSCIARANDDITWYVTTTLQPTEPGAGLEYMTFALGPKYFSGSPTGGDRELRYFLLNDYIVQSFMPGAYRFANQPNWDTIFSLNGLILHAIGSALGFVREDYRGGVLGDGGQNYWPEECNDGALGGIFLTDADAHSVMTHPSALSPFMANGACAGYRDFDYAISYADAMGAACQYRNAPNGALDILYYCNQAAQLSVVQTYGEECSPVPIGQAGNCNSSSTWDDRAQEYGVALLTAILGK